MLPGRFLGIARTTGDTFTFVIMTDDGLKSIALHRSVIRKRDRNSKDPYADYNTDEPLESEVPDEHIGGSQNNLSGEEQDPILQQNNFEEVILSGTSSTAVHVESKGNTSSNTGEIYNHFDLDLRCEEIDEIISSKFNESDRKLYLLVRWKDGQESFVSADLMQSDDPTRLAKFIKDKPVERLRGGYWSQWADRMLHAVSHTIRRIRRMYYTPSLTDNCYPYSRRVIRRKKAYPTKMETFMGIEIPRNTKEALYWDKKNKDNMWRGAMKVEVDSI
jgi:hypothetical protein